MVNREAIGIITGIDKPDANVERVRRWLQLAGCKKIFPVSSFTGEGIKELADYLKDDEGKKPRKTVKKATAKPVAKPQAETDAPSRQLATWLL